MKDRNVPRSTWKSHIKGGVGILTSKGGLRDQMKITFHGNF